MSCTAHLQRKDLVYQFESVAEEAKVRPLDRHAAAVRGSRHRHRVNRSLCGATFSGGTTKQGETREEATERKAKAT